MTTKKYHPSIYIGVWIFFSSAVITYNKYILEHTSFNFPIALTTWHLIFATFATRFLKQNTNLLPAAKNTTMSWRNYIQSIVPIGIFFSGSLVFCNAAYLHLTISFIQMLKATTPMVVLILSIMLGLKDFNMQLFLNVLGVVVGVIIASYGELHFVWIGVVIQAIGILFESFRLVLIQKLMTDKMDPLSSLYYFAPVGALFNSILFLIFEYPTMTWGHIESVGYFTLLTNASLAFLLNVAVVYMIGCTSSLALTLSGVLKDILIIATSMIFFHSRTSFTQVLGYSIALYYLLCYKLNTGLHKEYKRLTNKYYMLPK